MGALHPTTRLLLWLLSLVGVQCLDGWALAAAIVLLPALGPRIVRRAGSLVRRARWLLVSLIVILAWGTAGDPLWAAAYAPTRQGLAEAATHGARLVLVLAAVAALLETMPLPEMFLASHALGRPLRRIGLDVDRGIVRLMLVLRYLERLPRPRDWRSLLDVPPTAAEETLELSNVPLRTVDYAALAIACTAAVLIVIWSGV